MSLAIGFATAITPIVAEADSSKNIMGVKDALKHGLILCSIMGVSLYLLLMLVKPIMFEMNQPLEVVKLAIPYLIKLAPNLKIKSVIYIYFLLIC